MKRVLIFTIAIVLVIGLGIFIGKRIDENPTVPTSGKLENNTKNEINNKVEEKTNVNNVVETPQENKEEKPKTDLEKAIELVKKDWGEDNSVYFAEDGKNENDELIICEGPFDAMSMDEQAATCMCSGDLGVKQIEKIIAKKPNYIIYARDNDETGARTMKKNIGKLIMYGYDKPIYLFEMPEHIKDLNELKMKTGKNFILKKECSLYKQAAFNDQWLQKLTF